MVTYLEYTTLNDFRKGTFRTAWGDCRLCFGSGARIIAIVNACGEERPECFSVTYVFDLDALKNCLFYWF